MSVSLELDLLAGAVAGIPQCAPMHMKSHLHRIQNMHVALHSVEMSGPVFGGQKALHVLRSLHTHKELLFGATAFKDFSFPQMMKYLLIMMMYSQAVEAAIKRKPKTIIPSDIE